MGGHSYSAENYVHYSRTVADIPVEKVFSRKAIHEDMHPRGLGIREARDSDVHPNSIPVIIALDVTGSMGYIPGRLIKDDLSHLVQTIIDAGIPDPAICFIAVGDHTCDIVPLQVGQFESGDQQLIHWLSNTYIKEKGGGAGITESYALAWLFGSNHTATDHWEKRKQKGFLFTIGDEQGHSSYSADELKALMGYAQGESFTDEQLLKKAEEMWNVFHIHVNDANVKVTFVEDYWKNLLGDNFKVVQDHTSLATTIAGIVIEGSKIDENTSDDKSEESGKSSSTPML